MRAANIGQYAFVEPDHGVRTQGRTGAGDGISQPLMLVALFEEMHQSQVRRQVSAFNSQGFFKILRHLGSFPQFPQYLGQGSQSLVINRVEQGRLFIVSGSFRQPLPVFVDDAQVEPALGKFPVMPYRIVKAFGCLLQLCIA